MQDPVMKRLLEQWQELSRDESNWYEFEARRKAIADEFSALAEAERRGKHEGKLEVAKNLIARGMDLKLIAGTTGLSITELEELEKQLHSCYSRILETQDSASF